VPIAPGRCSADERVGRVWSRILAPCRAPKAGSIAANPLPTWWAHTTSCSQILAPCRAPAAGIVLRVEISRSGSAAHCARAPWERAEPAGPTSSLSVVPAGWASSGSGEPNGGSEVSLVVVAHGLGVTPGRRFPWAGRQVLGFSSSSSPSASSGGTSSMPMAPNAISSSR
jgi:hypothetical protein